MDGLDDVEKHASEVLKEAIVNALADNRLAGLPNPSWTEEPTVEMKNAKVSTENILVALRPETAVGNEEAAAAACAFHEHDCKIERGER